MTNHMPIYLGLQDSDEYGIWIDVEKERQFRVAGHALEIGDTVEALDEDDRPFDAYVLGRAEDGYLRFGVVIEHSKGKLITTWFG